MVMGRFAFLLFIVLGASSASAGIINVLGEADEDRMGLSGKAVAAVEWSTGSVNELQIEGEMTTRYRWPKRLAFLVLRGEYAAEGGEAHATSTFEHLRYRHSLSDLLTLEGFLQHESDPFRRLAFRGLVGAGPRIKVASWQRGTLHFGTAYMSETEQTNSDPTTTDSNQNFHRHRWSNYLSLSTALTERVSLGQTLFAQPQFTDFGSIRYFSETTVGIEIEGHLALNLQYIVRYDTAPYQAVPDTDTELKTELEWAF